MIEDKNPLMIIGFVLLIVIIFVLTFSIVRDKYTYMIEKVNETAFVKGYTQGQSNLIFQQTINKKVFYFENENRI